MFFRRIAMSDPFARLGLTHDADERAIKRAYASRLKATRPDEDPQGFQQLNEAYRAALQLAAVHANVYGGLDEGIEHRGTEMRSDRSPADDDERTAPSERATHATTVVDAQTGDDTVVRFDPEAFYAHLTALLLYCRDGELQHWLDAQPILWSLADKARLADWLLYRMHERQPPVSAAQFDRFANYFGLDDLHAGYDIVALRRLRDRLHLVWMLQTTQLRDLAERTYPAGSALIPAVNEIRRMLRQLSRPLHWPQALFAALRPGFPTAVRRFLHRLDGGRLHDLPPPIRAEQAAFWDAVADRSRLSKVRAVSALIHCAAYATLPCLLGMLYDALRGASVTPVDVLQSFASWFFAFAAGWAAANGAVLFVRWQCRQDVGLGRFRLPHRATIPVLALASVALTCFAQMETTATLLGVFGVVVAWHRFRGRGGSSLGLHRKTGAWILLPLMFGIVLLSWLIEREPRVVLLMFPLAALALWGMDALRLFRTP